MDYCRTEVVGVRSTVSPYASPEVATRTNFKDPGLPVRQAAETAPHIQLRDEFLATEEHVAQVMRVPTAHLLGPTSLEAASAAKVGCIVCWSCIQAVLHQAENQLIIPANANAVEV